MELLNKPIVGVTTSDRPYQNGGKMSSENLKKPEAPYLLGLCHPLQISVNPSVCLVKNDVWGNFQFPEDFGAAPDPTADDTTIPGDPGPQVKDSAGNSINIDFDGNLTSVEDAAKTTIDLVIPQVLTDYGDMKKKLQLHLVNI